MAQEAKTGTDWEQRALGAEAALEEALAERNRLWAELHERAASDRELEYYRNLTQKMEDSLSWRITTPLRTLKRLWISGRPKVRRLLEQTRAGRSG
jgi:hypothetical protein